MNRKSVFALLSLSALALLACPSAWAQTPAKPSKTLSLKADGHIGKVVDCQGLVSLKAGTSDRWTPVTTRARLFPGDLLRTDIRGANACQIRMKSGGQLILGPGSLIEVQKSGLVRVFKAECEALAGKAQSLTLTMPNKLSIEVKNSRKCLRVSRQDVTELKAEPSWLKGFKGSITKESMGSLVAQVDGRAVPLGIGYHKVSVDIRDQIARTTIEESFLNRTDSQLEGVFYFPLPQDASISGFGMWINGELVEADVVEKQRARQIYETILREKRDPGLLEWTGGNLFKARVFPIFPNSEKRVKITYTQVLPERNGQYRYQYALKSDMLQSNPLRELQLTVRVDSARALKSLRCPSHDALIKTTKNAASVSFSAQEYRPENDFEVVIEPAKDKDQKVWLIPHQRGDDGYFVMMFSPPDPAGGWQRALLGEGQGLDLVLLVDTSGSIGSAERKQQAKVILSLLSSLGSKDRFNLATVDTKTQWLFKDSQSVDASSVDKALQFFEGRQALGWSDLRAGFSEALGKATEQTHIVYLGDGIDTAGDGDSAKLSQDLRQLYKGKGHVHTLSFGSLYEASVLKTLASLGGGSMRRVGDQEVAVVKSLLQEITQPALKELSVQFQGFRTARVYPEVLPNLAKGSQQIVIGRYLPRSKQGPLTTGEVVVKGVYQGKNVAFKSKVQFGNAESGNSFIPRLWARKHLDYLLEQGAGVKDEVIALSERFHIMTPYTSFLVLESDADRKRFGVKRRFRMRDGEKFFQEGRDRAQFALLAKQMKSAGVRRMNLRRQLIMRNSRFYREPLWTPEFYNGLYGGAGVGGGGGGGGGGGTLSFGDEDESESSSRWGGKSSPKEDTSNNDLDDDSDDSSLSFDSEEGDEGEPGESEESNDADEDFGDDDREPGATDDSDEFPGPELGLAAPGRRSRSRLNFGEQADYELSSGGLGLDFGRGLSVAPSNPQNWQSTWMIYQLVPLLGQLNMPEKTEWTGEALTLSQSLDRSESLKQLRQSGLIIKHSCQYFRPDNQTPTRKTSDQLVFQKSQWLSLSRADHSGPVVERCNDKEQAMFRLSLLLGRRQTIPKNHSSEVPPNFTGFVWAPHRFYSGAKFISLEKDPKDSQVKRIKVRYDNEAESYTVFVVDPKRRVIVRREDFYKGQLTNLMEYSQFTNLGGQLWPQHWVNKNDLGQRLGEGAIQYQVNAGEAADKMAKDAWAPAKDVLFFPQLFDTLEQCLEAQNRKQLTAMQSLTLAFHHMDSQRWSASNRYFQSFAEKVKDKPGLDWVRLAYTQRSRNGAAFERALKTLLTVLQKASQEPRAA